MDIDLVRLNLNQTSINILNVIIAIIMFGVALNLSISDFTRLFKKPIPFLTGLLGFYVIFPALTLGLIQVLNLRPSIALGLILIAACPSGNLANVFTNLSKGNTALTVGLVSITTILSTMTLPFILFFFGKNISGAPALLTEINIDAWEMFYGIFLMLGTPLASGMIISQRFPNFSKRAYEILNKVSFIFLIVFVVAAFVANFNHFINYFNVILGVVFLQSFLGFGLGFLLGYFSSKELPNALGLSYFMGTRNTALGLAIVFQFFAGLGGMALIVAFYGVSQITLGILSSQLLKKLSIKRIYL